MSAGRRGLVAAPHYRRIREKRFLHRIYEEWYSALTADIGDNKGLPVLEVGAGQGFFKEAGPGVIASDVVAYPNTDVVLRGEGLPFRGGSLAGIAMTNVLHHMVDPRAFFRESARCVVAGGRMAMLEPWITPFSRLIYSRFHHEPMDIDTPDWDFGRFGPEAGANEALPWIIFQRDRDAFRREFPQWDIRAIRPAMPLRYLVSGGVRPWSLIPGWAFGTVTGLEKALEPLFGLSAMFAYIVLERRP